MCEKWFPLRSQPAHCDPMCHCRARLGGWRPRVRGGIAAKMKPVRVYSDLRQHEA